MAERGGLEPPSPFGRQISSLVPYQLGYLSEGSLSNLCVLARPVGGFKTQKNPDANIRVFLHLKLYAYLALFSFLCCFALCSFAFCFLLGHVSPPCVSRRLSSNFASLLILV